VLSCGQRSLIDRDQKDWEKPVQGSNPASILPCCDAKDGWWAEALGVSPPGYVVANWDTKAVVQMQRSKGRLLLFFLPFCRGNAGDRGTPENAPVALWKWWMTLVVLCGPELP